MADPRDEAGTGAGQEWFVAFTNPRREDRLERMVRARAFAAYVPAMTVTRTVSRRRVTASRPLFPRYVFVGLSGGQQLYGLRQTPHLEGVLKVGGNPYRVDPAILAGLRAAEAAGTYDFTDEREAVREAAAKAEREADAYANAARDLRPGTRVSVLEGPFRSFTGTVDELLLPGRVAVTIAVFGSRHSVPMRIGDVALAGRGAP